MTEAILLFLSGLIGTLVLTPAAIRLAHAWGGLDQPDSRKIHKKPVPRLGGLAVVGSFGLTIGLALLASPAHRAVFVVQREYWLSLGAGAALVFLLGLYDDLRGASIWVKFAVQFTAASFMIFWAGIRIEQIRSPFGGPLSLGWLGIPFTALWIVGVTNALNLIDGLDGLAGGISFIAVTAIFVISLVVGAASFVILITAILAGALLGFLRYNLHPARIFLGDCGSMFLGYMLAVLSLAGIGKSATALAILIPILVVGVPVFDTLYSMVRRLLSKLFIEKEWRMGSLLAMFQADRAHIHHTLMEMGFTHSWTVVILYGLSTLFGLLALIAVVLNDDRVSFGLILVGIVAFVLMKHYANRWPLEKWLE